MLSKVFASDDVVLFMKGTPVFPQCGFSAAVVGVLSHLGIKFSGVNVLDDDEIREGIKAYSDWPTIPQLYVFFKFVVAMFVGLFIWKVVQEYWLVDKEDKGEKD